MMGDSTLSEVVNCQDHPVRYVQGIQANLAQYAEEGSDLLVRIGINGTGKAPNYRIERDMDGTGRFRGAGSDVVEVFDGRSHQPRTGTKDTLANEKNWSSVAVSAKEVENLLQRLLQPKRVTLGIEF